MNKPVGGRGHKAPYQTVVVRIPVDLKSQVDELVDRFRENDKSETKTVNLKTIIKRYKLNSKSTRDWVQFNKLITELERELDKAGSSAVGEVGEKLSEPEGLAP
jgi:hypothetical protein